MARSQFTINYQCSFDEAQRKVEYVLQRKGFHQETIKSGEHVWKKGIGFFTAMKFIKVDYAADKILLSAWVQVGLGSIGGGEMDLTGVTGAIPKKQLMKVIEEIKQAF